MLCVTGPAPMVVAGILQRADSIYLTPQMPGHRSGQSSGGVVGEGVGSVGTGTSAGGRSWPGPGSSGGSLGSMIMAFTFAKFSRYR